MEGILKCAMCYMVEVFEDLKARSLGCQEREELAEEIEHGEGETVTTEAAGGAAGSTKTTQAV